MLLKLLEPKHLKSFISYFGNGILFNSLNIFVIAIFPLVLILTLIPISFKEKFIPDKTLFFYDFGYSFALFITVLVIFLSIHPKGIIKLISQVIFGRYLINYIFSIPFFYFPILFYLIGTCLFSIYVIKYQIPHILHKLSSNTTVTTTAVITHKIGYKENNNIIFKFYTSFNGSGSTKNLPIETFEKIKKGDKIILKGTNSSFGFVVDEIKY